MAEQKKTRKTPAKAVRPSTERKAATNSKLPTSKTRKKKRKERLHTLLLAGIEGEPGLKYEVSSIDAQPGQPVGRGSNLGYFSAIGSKNFFRDSGPIYSEEYGVIKEIYLKVGDIVTAGQPFALIELFNEAEFPRRFDEYVTVADSCSELILVDYPLHFESKYPEILRRVAKLMTAFYYDWCEDCCDHFASPRDKKFAASGYYVSCCTECDEPEPHETWSVSRLMYFGGDRAQGLENWFDDSVLVFSQLDINYGNARNDSISSKSEHRHSNVLRWVYEMERAISKDSTFGDSRITELYEIIELEEGVEFRSKG
jgi:biotin carboxyl carrier protein